jgi:voltage-gated potassium channel
VRRQQRIEGVGVRQSQEALDHYESKWNIPLLVLSALWILVVIAETCELLGWIGLSSGQKGALFVADLVLWSVFLADYIVRVFLLAPKRLAYALQWLNLFDVVVLLSVPVLLVARTAILGYVRFFRMVSVGLRLIRGGTHVHAQTKRAAPTLRVAAGRILAVFASVVVIVSVIVVWRAEKDVSGASIKSLWDALWWATVTLFTIGYGDKYPITPGGRVAAVFLMVVGIALFGWLTATLASLVAGQDRASETKRLRSHLEREFTQIDERLDSRLARIERALGIETREEPDT